MRVIHINRSDSDGGAAKAAYRLNSALRCIDVESKMLVYEKNSDFDDVIKLEQSKADKVINKYKEYKERFILSKYKNRDNIIFSTGLYGVNIDESDELRKTDIIHLHWINSTYVSIDTIKKLSRFGKPIVWTLHDNWPLTGGCHVKYGCEKFQNRCGNCPILKSHSEEDITRKIIMQKEKAFEGLNMTIVTPSKWMFENAKRSYLFKNKRIELIPNCIDSDLYKPIGKSFAREALNMDKEKFIISFGAVEATSVPYKGYKYLIEALNILANNNPHLKDEIEVVIFGASNGENVDKIPFKTKFLGRLYDDASLVLVYNASDVFVGPSLEESFGQTYMEAISCGTPAIAFSGTGSTDVIAHKKSGYLAEFRNSGDFAKGIYWVYENRHNLDSNFGRQYVIDKFSYTTVGNMMKNLYETLI